MESLKQFMNMLRQITSTWVISLIIKKIAASTVFGHEQSVWLGDESTASNQRI